MNQENNKLIQGDFDCEQNAISANLVPEFCSKLLNLRGHISVFSFGFNIMEWWGFSVVIRLEEAIAICPWHRCSPEHISFKSSPDTLAPWELCVITLIDPSSCSRVTGYLTRDPISMQIKVSRVTFLYPSFLPGAKKKPTQESNY